MSKTNATRLFVTRTGRPFDRNNLSLLVRCYTVRAGMTMKGSCHLLRHTAATLMMERGADLRSLQELLGHKRVTTTQIYTHVSIRRLQDVHRQTHPARPNNQRPSAPHANAAQRNTEHPHAAEPHAEQTNDHRRTDEHPDVVDPNAAHPAAHRPSENGPSAAKGAPNTHPPASNGDDDATRSAPTCV